MPPRILLAGLFHETHTFLEGTTGLDEFAVRRGDELLTTRGDGSPLSGAIEVADNAGWELLPAIDLRATPSAIVEDAVVELFWKEVRELAERELPQGIDGIFLVLHGAMVTQSLPDVEGEIIDRARRLPGATDIPLCGVLDLHGNISRRTIEPSQCFVAYRCNPHVDARGATVDAARLLDQIINEGLKPTAVWERPPVMWPPTGTGTADVPMKTLEAMARDIEQQNPDIAVVNVFGGFSFADTPDTGVSFSAVTFGDPAVARNELRRLSEWTVAHQETGNVVDPPLDEVLPAIREALERGETPVLIVEPADNIGGGAPGDATSILRTLIENEIANSAVVINDPQAVQQLSNHTIGETVELSIGGQGSPLTEGPVTLKAELVLTSDGRFELEDHNSHLASMYGIQIDMGPSALIHSGGVTILLTSHKTPPFDLGQLRSQGIEPEACSVIGVKAAVGHRRAYDKLGGASFTVSTPGPCTSDIKSLPFNKVIRPVFPLD